MTTERDEGREGELFSVLSRTEEGQLVVRGHTTNFDDATDFADFVAGATPDTVKVHVMSSVNALYTASASTPTFRRDRGR